MVGWFEIDVKPRGDMLRLTMGGFFDAAGVERLHIALVRAIAKLGCGPNRHLTLCDIKAMNIQSQDVVAVFASLVGRPEIRSRRLAFVTGTTLARLQARRLTNRPDVDFFSDEAAATAWLLALETA